MNCRLLLQIAFLTLLPNSLMAAPELEFANVENAFPAVTDFHYPDHLSSIRYRLTIHDIPAPRATGNSQAVPSLNAKTVQKQDSFTQPVFQWSLDTLANLSSVTKEQVTAALRVQKKMRDRKLKLLDYIFTDANGDGKLDVVSISLAGGSKSKRQLILDVFEIDDENTPILRYENAQTAGDSLSQEQYVRGIYTRSPGFTLCEDWSIASWNIHECHDLLFSSEWNPGVLNHFIQTTEPKAHSVQSNSFDFQNRIAARNYERIPDGPFMPPLRRQSSYAMMFAGFDDNNPVFPLQLDTQLSAVYPPSEHPPIQYAMSWNSSGLNMSFTLADSDVQVLACSDQMSVQQADHLELWFDLNASLDIRRDNPQSWLLEYEKSYQNEPYRHSLDSDIFGIAVLPTGCVVPMAPTRDNWRVMPEMVTHTLPGGYRVDVFIPAKFFGIDDMNSLDRTLGIGFTARQHDLHDSAPYDSIATSEWQWPDPYTFGQIWLLAPSSSFPPPFPLQWNTWLLDN